VGSSPKTQSCSVLSPNGTIVNLSPTWFRIDPQGRQYIECNIPTFSANSHTYYIYIYIHNEIRVNIYIFMLNILLKF